MIVKAVKNWGHWTVRLTQGCQSFHLDIGPTERTKKRAQWFAKQLRGALVAHNAGIIENYFSFEHVKPKRKAAKRTPVGEFYHD